MQIVPEYVPQEFGVLLLTLALILTLTPYLAGHDLGIFKVPQLKAGPAEQLRWLGPALLLMAVLLHVPLWEKSCDEPVYELVADENLCGSMREEFVVTPARPATCRHQDFGQEGWGRSQVVDRSSGWREGGYSQGNWCNHVLDGFLRSRTIAVYDHEVLDKGERSRKDWKAHVTYRYSCKIRVNWEPVFAERTDEKCGTLPAVVEWRKVPAQCRKQVGTRRVPCSSLSPDIAQFGSSEVSGNLCV